MKVFKTRSYSSCIESGLFGSEALNITKVCKQLSAIDEFQHKIEVFAVLSKSLKVNDKGMADMRVHIVFIVDVINLLGFDNLVFAQQF